MNATIYLHPMRSLGLIITITFALIAIDVAMSGGVRLIVEEGRSIEITSASLFVAATIFWIVLQTDDQSPRNWHVPVILILMSMRELDFDKHFTTEGILQLRLYTSPAPILEKLIGGLFIILILVCAFRLITINVPRWLRGLRKGMATSWLVALAGILLALSKSLDGIYRKLEPLGISLQPETLAMTTRGEEVFELVMAMCLVTAVTFYTRDHREDTELQSSLSTLRLHLSAQ